MRTLLTLSVYILLATGISGCQPTPPEQQLLDQWGNRVVIPWHQHFADTTAQLNRTSNTFCRNELTETQLQTLREQWLTAMAAWQQLQVIKFGPILHDNQSWKIQFWPDSHNLIRKKIQQLLDGDDDITPERIAKASVVVQGLSALEFLLFDQQSNTVDHYRNNPRRCQLLQSVAAHSQKVADYLLNQWQQDGHYLTVLTKPSADNGEFPNYNSAIAAIVDSLVASIEQVKKDKLEKPLGYHNKKQTPRPYLSEAWRSRQSITLLKNNIAAINALYNGGAGYGLDDYLVEVANKPLLASDIEQQFTAIDSILATIELPLFEAVKNPTEKQKLQRLHQHVVTLIALFKHQLPAALGVSLGFNANDGD